MVPITSGRGRADPVGTPLLRLSPPLGVPSATTADLDALGTAAELKFGDSAARSSHADWVREQQAEPAYHATMRYIVLAGRRPYHPTFHRVFPSHLRRSFLEIQNLLEKAGYAPPTTAADFFVVFSLRPSAVPSWRLMSLLAKAGCTPPTTA